MYSIVRCACVYAPSNFNEIQNKYRAIQHNAFIISSEVIEFLVRTHKITIIYAYQPNHTDIGLEYHLKLVINLHRHDGTIDIIAIRNVNRFSCLIKMVKIKTNFVVLV